jgi:hypothetical protein
MGFSVRCECGETLPVSANDAGTVIACRCTRSVEVPRLSALRAMAGAADDYGSVLERVRSQIKRGELPSNAICPLTEQEATTTLWLEILCEREWSRRSDADDGKVMLLLMLGGWLGMLYAVMRGGARETLGSDVSIMAPLRLSSSGAAKVMHVRWQRTFKRLLSKTPIYKELLRSYPQARVVRVVAEYSTLEGPGMISHAGIFKRRAAK